MGPQWEIQASSFKAVEHIIHKTKNLKIKDNASKISLRVLSEIKRLSLMTLIIILILLHTTCSVPSLYCVTVYTVMAFLLSSFLLSGQTIQTTLMYSRYCRTLFINRHWKNACQKCVIHSYSSHLHGYGGLAKWILSTNEKRTFHTLLVNRNIYTALSSRCRSLSSCSHFTGIIVHTEGKLT